MGYVELMESIKRITSIPIPEGASMVFSAALGGITFGHLVLTAMSANGCVMEWNIEKVPTSEQLAFYSREIHRMSLLPTLKMGRRK